MNMIILVEIINVTKINIDVQEVIKKRLGAFYIFIAFFKVTYKFISDTFINNVRIEIA